MPTKLNDSAAVATLSAICMMAGVKRADEGTDDGFNAGDPVAQAVDCRADIRAESTAIGD